MKLKEKKLLLQALKGNADAWRKLALLTKNAKEGSVDRELCRFFLNKAIELGDEESYFLYHQLFTEDAAKIDGKSYQDMIKEYQETENQQVKEVLRRYLELLEESKDMPVGRKEEEL
ncbi:MAG: hypothetical protein Q4E89_11665 [Eubacteriales bacterium]|nr:hypothetical protein [Eubacteriales bacterium]